ncbi:DUF5723 family protein [Portibacter marinus]|uniref:DUF5723 family protein n=1 Tax=Portibacter marinus TaxID=2898660 RepID=UPI001F29EEBC|nr:DUF5723 family protein [Portibacter marinus]
MKKVAILLLMTLGLNAQQEFGTYFLNNLHQSSELNPAFDVEQQFVVGLPSFYGVMHQRGISITSALNGRLLDLVGPRRNQVMLGTNVSLIKLSYKRDRIRYNFAHNYRHFTDFQFGNPLVELVAGGNASVIGGSVMLQPNIGMTTYSETVLGLAYTGNFSFGANVKLLNGIHNLHTERSAIELSVNEDIYQLELNADFLLNSSFPINLQNLQLPSILSFNFVPNNFGLAFDLGISYQNGPIRISASALDLGFLNWAEQVHNYETQGTFVYDGADLEDVIGGNFNFIDTIGAILDFTDARADYRYFVPAKFYGNVSYALTSKVNLGGLIYAHQNFDRLNGGAVINIQRHWNNRHAIAFQYGVVGSNPLNLGLSGYTTLGPVQLYAVSDHILGTFKAFGAENLNLRIGMNLVFQKREQSKSSQYAVN